MPEGPPPWPVADEAVREALQQAYVDGSWGRYQGPHSARLMAALGEFFQVEFVTLCCSGTLAVQLALRGLGIGPGDEVLLAGYDFAGNFRSIEAIGARPVLVEVDAGNWNLDSSALAAGCQPATRAIVVSHLHGGVVPMRAVMGFAQSRGIAVVEDACQAPGSIVEGRLAGTWGDAGVLSFGGSKLLTAGRGGAVLTQSAAVQQRIKVFSEQGNQAFPLSELQAAVLAPQLAKLPVRNEQRAASVALLLRQLESSGVLGGLMPFTNKAEDSHPGYYKLGLQYRAEAFGNHSRAQFIAAAQAEGIALDVGFRGFIHRSSRRCRQAGPLVHARVASEDAIVLHHPILLEPPEVILQLAAAITKVTRSLASEPCFIAGGKDQA
jgi:perosamine synthetase